MLALFYYSCDPCPHRNVARIKSGFLSMQIKIKFHSRSEYQAMRRTTKMEHAKLIPLVYILTNLNGWITG